MADAKPSVAGASRLLVAALSGVILVSAASVGHMFTGVVGAVGFWFGAERMLAWFAHSNKASADEDLPAAELDADLAPVLARLETTRVDMAAEIDRRMRLRLPAGLAAGVLFWAWTQVYGEAPGLIPLALLSVIGAGAGWAWAAAALSERYRRMYKSEVLPRLAASLGALEYRAATRPDASALRDQRLFPRFDRVDAEDEIVGSYHGVAISIMEVALVDTKPENDRKVFDGLLVRLTLPRTLDGTTAVIADTGLLGALRDLMGGSALQRVRLEDARFEDVYQVYGTDQIAARALLTPAFMERFLSLGERTGFMRPLALAQGNRLTITLAKQGYDNLFEPPDYRRPAGSRAALAKLHDDLQAVLRVAEAVIDLDQSLRNRPSTLA